MIVHQIPAHQDNYIYILDIPGSNLCVSIDATEEHAITDYCQQNQKKLAAILNTHHHHDHVEANLELQKKFSCDIYALESDSHRIPGTTHKIQDGTRLSFGSLNFEVLKTPGHTLGHICYHEKKNNLLFCGDTLFRFGCGRLFEGTAEMMVNSLEKIKNLSGQTQVYCAHEYTLQNIEFCLALEPDHLLLQKSYETIKKLRAQNKSTVPFLLSEQIEQSPFLRWNDPLLKSALGLQGASDTEVFAEVRRRRNEW